MHRSTPPCPRPDHDARDLVARLLAVGAGVALCALAAAQGLPGAAPDVPDAPAGVAAGPADPLVPPASAPAVDAISTTAPAIDAAGLVRVVGRARADVARPGPPAAPAHDWRRWPGVLGVPAAPLGGFADLALAPRAAAPAPARASRPSPTATPRRPDPAPGDAFVVMIDPGHGGTDPGSVAPNGLLEKELTADIAARVRRFLSEVEGVEVRLTREGDTGLSRQGRVDRIRAAGADLVVSLHFNHLPQSHVTLVESYYAAAENIEESRAIRAAAGEGEFLRMTAPDLSFTEGSERLAGLMQRRVFGEVAHGNPDATDAGVKRDTLFVLTRSFVPGALIELTCLSNPAEAERLATDEYRTRLAAALADAVRDYRASLADRPLGSLDT